MFEVDDTPRKTNPCLADASQASCSSPYRHWGKHFITRRWRSVPVARTDDRFSQCPDHFELYSYVALGGLRRLESQASRPAHAPPTMVYLDMKS